MHALVLALVLAATTNNPSGEFANIPYGSTKDQVKKLSPNVHQGETDDILIDTKDTAFGQPVEAIRFVFDEGKLTIVLVQYAVDDKEKLDADKIAEAVIKNLVSTYGKGKMLMTRPTKLVSLWNTPKGQVNHALGATTLTIPGGPDCGWYPGRSQLPGRDVRGRGVLYEAPVHPR